MRVLCLTTLPTIGAGNRLRVEQYVRPMSAMGIELVVSPFFDEGSATVLYEPGRSTRKVGGVFQGVVRRLRDAWRAGEFDLVHIYRESLPIGPPIFEAYLRARRIPYVFDFDDALFLAPIHPVNRRWRWLRHPSRVGYTTTHAARVIVSNEYLADWARRFNAMVSVIPTAVDTDLHRPRPHGTGPVTVIGWIGSTTTSPYLQILDGPLAALSQRGDILFRVIGGRFEHVSAPVEVRPYRLETEPEDVSTFDIGVLPQPDDPWTRGKAAFKALLYMATGIPVVASRGGVNESVVRHGVTGYCVTTSDEWVDALHRLMKDPALRAEMGRAGRAMVEEHFSVKVLAPRLADVLRSAVRGTPTART